MPFNGALNRWTLALCALAGCASGGGVGGSDPGRAAPLLEYRLYVTNESSDLVSRIVFDPVNGARVEREIPVGVNPGATEGPHGVSVSPDGEAYYVTIAHGTPDGAVWKLSTGSDSLLARTTLGRFPASSGLTSDGQFLLVVNFNLHGDPVPSDLSVVFTPDLREIARIPTCVMPHGSRTNASGTHHYHVCMHSDQLVELRVPTFAPANRFSLHPGAEGLLELGDLGGDHAAHAAETMCSPTWVTPGVGARADRFVYLTCNRRGEILEVDVEEWRVTRRIPAGPGPYNIELTPDGRRLVATLRGGAGIVVIDLDRGEVLAELPTTRAVTHGVVIDPGGRYAFVTNESIGGLPGTLDVFDLEALELVSSVELRLQPGGVDLWRVDPIGTGPTPESGP